MLGSGLLSCLCFDALLLFFEVVEHCRCWKHWHRCIVHLGTANQRHRWSYLLGCGDIYAYTCKREVGVSRIPEQKARLRANAWAKSSFEQFGVLHLCCYIGFELFSISCLYSLDFGTSLCFFMSFVVGISCVIRCNTRFICLGHCAARFAEMLLTQYAATTHSCHMFKELMCFVAVARTSMALIANQSRASCAKHCA